LTGGKIFTQLSRSRTGVFMDHPLPFFSWACSFGNLRSALSDVVAAGILVKVIVARLII
jgi:hypothetical protein